MSEKCPRCDSPNPKLHPAMQYEGEVQECSHRFHGAKKIEDMVSIPLMGDNRLIIRETEADLESIRSDLRKVIMQLATLEESREAVSAGILNILDRLDRIESYLVL